MSKDAQTGASVDPKEVAKFAALAAEWWDQKGKFAPLHRLNPVRLAFIKQEALALVPPPPPAGEVARATERASSSARTPPLRLAVAPLDTSPAGGGGRRRVLAGLRILDIGCGGGLVSAPLSRLGAAVTGIDASSEAIEAANAYAREAGLTIDFRAATAEALAGESFDLVLALEIVEHVADVSAFLAACAALVRPGGKLIVSTINRTAGARALALFAAERVLGWAPEGTHDYEKLVTPEELAAAASELEWAAPVGLSFDPLQRAWKLSSDVSINYFRVAVRKA